MPGVLAAIRNEWDNFVRIPADDSFIQEAAMQCTSLRRSGGGRVNNLTAVQNTFEAQVHKGPVT